MIIKERKGEDRIRKNYYMFEKSCYLARRILSRIASLTRRSIRYLKKNNNQRKKAGMLGIRAAKNTHNKHNNILLSYYVD